MAPMQIVTAVKKVTAKEERSRNIMIYGMVKSQQENVLEDVKTILSEIDEKPVITECRRVGTQKTGAIRPVKFAVISVIVTEAKFKYTEPDKVHIIKNNKFVSLERKHEPAQTRPI